MGKRFIGWRRHRRTLIDIVKFLLLAAGAIWLLSVTSGRVSYYWQWYRVPRYLIEIKAGQWTAGPLLQGLWVTVKITGISLVLAFAVGLATALLRLSSSALGRVLARSYLELVRNTPLLVQLFFVYFILAPVFDFTAWTAAVMALSLFEGAYASEIFRAGIVSIHRGQWEAAFSLGLDTFNTYRLVVLPQAIRRILPPLTGQAISLIFSVPTLQKSFKISGTIIRTERDGIGVKFSKKLTPYQKELIHSAIRPK